MIVLVAFSGARDRVFWCGGKVTGLTSLFLAVDEVVCWTNNSLPPPYWRMHPNLVRRNLMSPHSLEPSQAAGTNCCLLAMPPE